MQEYDGTIADLRAELVELRPLTGRVATFDQEHGIHMRAADEKHRAVLMDRDREIESLRAQIYDSEEAQRSMKLQVAKLVSEVSAISKKYNHEQAAKMMLLSQTNELRQYKIEMEAKAQKSDVGSTYASEVVKRKLLEGLETAQSELRELKATYAEVVPLAVHDGAVRELKELRTKFARASDELDVLRTQNSELSDAVERAATERRHIEMKLKKLARSASTT